MANWSNPTLTSLYTDFVTEVKNRDVDLALGLDPATTSPTNVPANAIRWNSASFKYQKWDGSTWNDLSAKYIFTAVEVSGSTVPVNGMYLSTTNTLNFSTASTASRLTIDGSGNVNIDSGTFYVDAVNNRVGVGTTGPSYALHVLSSSTASVKFGASSAIDTQALIGNSAGDLIIRTTSSGDSIIASDTGKYLAFGTNGVSEKMRLGASGNLGLGVVPSAWRSIARALQLGASSALEGLSNNGSYVALYSNAYNNGANFIYQNTAQAGLYQQSLGVNSWHTAPSGTAGDPITFTQAMTLDASGRLLIGQTGTGLQAARSLAWQGSGEGALYMSHSTSDGNGDPFINFGYNANLIGKLIQVGNTGIGLYSNDALTFGTVGSERARINNLGYMQGTVNGLGAGRIPAKQYYRLDSAFTGTNGTAAQSIYGVGVTLIGSTVYEFEAIYALVRSSGSTSHTISFLFGGTATINNIFYTGVGPGEGVLPPLSTYDGAPASFVATSAGASVATTAMTIGTGIFYIVKGTVSINAGGTFIPQYQLSAAPGGAYSTYAGAYFSIWPLAASGAAVNIGSWA